MKRFFWHCRIIEAACLIWICSILVKSANMHVRMQRSLLRYTDRKVEKLKSWTSVER